MRKIEDYIWISRITLFVVSIIFGLLFHISFLWVIAMWYAIVYSLEKITWLKYTLVFETTLLVFIILSSYLWTALWFYDIFWWWDKMLHFMYGFCFAFIGYKIIESVFKKRGVKNQLFITVAFAFCFAVAIWGIWEVLEYFFDKIWLFFYGEEVWTPLVQTSPGLNTIDDTMNDIIIETISALILNSMLYAYYHFWFFTFFGNLELIIKEKKKKLQKKMKKWLEAIEEKVEEIIKKND